MLGSVISLQPGLSLFKDWVQSGWTGLNKRATALQGVSEEVKGKLREKWHPLHSAQYLWSKAMLANNLLSCLGDRTEMAHSIEARPPFLDHVVSEYVNKLPPTVKIAYSAEKAKAAAEGPDNSNPMWWQMPGAGFKAYTEKWILREAGRPYITQELYERKKHPYSAPARWPKGGPLNKMFEKLLTKEAVEALGFVDYSVVADALEKGFGDESDLKSFRTLLFVGSWVAIGQRFGVKTAKSEDWAGKALRR